jgi:polysaccharide transporter, PST family
VVGLVSGQILAGYYSIVQKFSSGVVGLVQPVSQGLYPYLSRQFQENQKKYYASQRLLLFSALFISTAFGTIAFVFAEPIISILAGENFPDLTALMRIFSFTTSLVIMNVFLLSSILVMKLYSEMQSIFVRVAILFLIFSFPVTYQFGSIGMASLIVVVESIVCFSVFQKISVSSDKNSFKESGS